MPRLSVLMSAYRAEHTVGLAVSSTLRSLPADAELVVAVDGPGQGPTEEVLDRLEDRRLRVVLSDRNLGLAGQLQRLMELTDSQYVARMDADDVSLPWRFRTSMPALAHADYVFTSGIRMGGKLVSLSYPLGLNSAELCRALLFFTPVFHPSLVAARKAMESAGGYRKLRYGEDTEFWIRAAASGQRLIKIATPCIAYRLSPGQMSSQSGVDQRLERDPAMVESFRSLAIALGLSPVGEGDVARVDVSQRELETLLLACRPSRRRYLRQRILASDRLVLR